MLEATEVSRLDWNQPAAGDGMRCATRHTVRTLLIPDEGRTAVLVRAF